VGVLDDLGPFQNVVEPEFWMPTGTTPLMTSLKLASAALASLSTPIAPELPLG
jgi:hypothetical protein